MCSKAQDTSSTRRRSLCNQWLLPKLGCSHTVTPKGLVQPREEVRRGSGFVSTGKSTSGLNSFLGVQKTPEGRWCWWQTAAWPGRPGVCYWERCLSSLPTTHSVSLCCLDLTSPCKCDPSLGACYPIFYLHHTGSIQVIKQKTSFYYCCCFYYATAMSFIRALLFLWAIISGNLDRILWLTLEKVIKSWEPKMLLCCFHQTSFPILKNVLLCSDLFPDLRKISL